MKSALLIQSIILPAILANLLTVDLVAPLDNDYGGLTVTGKKQSSDEKPVTMSQTPGDKAVCLGADNTWTWYCGGGPSFRYIDRIGFIVETQDPRTLILERQDPELGIKYIVHCNLTVIGEGDLGNLVWDVTRGQKGLLGYDMEEGFESNAIEIECDPIWANSALVNEFGYQEGLSQAQASGHYLPYGV